jgi:uncharacterized protein YigE (DUF2233 family)
MRTRVLGLVAACLASQAHAVDCSRSQIDGKSALVCRVDTHQEQLHLYLNDAVGRPIQTFPALERMVTARGERLVFAMNAGMFEPNYSPVGLFIENRKQLAPLNTSNGQGNFFLQPNGVFFVGKGGPGILESAQFAALHEEIELATQSGPLLVRAGSIHPLLKATSTSRLIRNGVGVDGSTTVVFAISDDPMNLHEFARLFRDVLHCPDALYFDGVVSSVYAAPVRVSVQRAQLGPIIGVVESAPPADPKRVKTAPQ